MNSAGPQGPMWAGSVERFLLALEKYCSAPEHLSRLSIPALSNVAITFLNYNHLSTVTIYKLVRLISCHP